MSYSVGQVLYLLINEEMKIVPAQVVEVVIRHKFNEDVSTSYNLMLPGKTSAVVNLDDIDASIFTDVNELRSFMLGNATSNIDRMISKALRHAEHNFAPGGAPVQEDAPVV